MAHLYVIRLYAATPGMNQPFPIPNGIRVFLTPDITYKNAFTRLKDGARPKWVPLWLTLTQMTQLLSFFSFFTLTKSLKI